MLYSHKKILFLRSVVSNKYNLGNNVICINALKFIDRFQSHINIKKK